MKTYTAVVASDSFVDMLKHGNAHRMKLSMLCEAILRSKQAASDADQDAIFSDSSEPLLQAAAAIVYLLQPLPLQGLESVATAEKVAMTLKGTSKSPVLPYVKDCFREPFWAGLWNEAMTRGMTTLESAPQIEKLCASLEGDVPVSGAYFGGPDTLPAQGQGALRGVGNSGGQCLEAGQGSSREGRGGECQGM